MNATAEQSARILKVTPARFVTIELAEAVTGLTASAIRNNIGKGVWVEGRQYRRRNGAVQIDIEGFERWVEGEDEPASPAPQPPVKARRPPSPGPTQLYRHFDAAGRLLYVGISLSTVHRLGQHRNAARWAREIVRIDIQIYPSRADAERAEREAIRTENPIHNIAHRRKDDAQSC